LKQIAAWYNNEGETFVLVFVGITLMFLADSCQGDRKMVEGETEDSEDRHYL
jgi:hypothetical protein